MPGQAGRKYLEPAEWDFWYEGKPAAKELPDPFGTIIVEKGEVRDAGSYWNRCGSRPMHARGAGLRTGPCCRPRPTKPRGSAIRWHG